VQAGFDGTPAFVSHAGRVARREQKWNTWPVRPTL
jgi:hypothetical protein